MEDKNIEEINVITKPNAGEIKDFKISLNTASSGKSSYTTGRIKGYLDSIIIDASQSVSFKIAILDYENVPLFESNQVFGFHIIPLRIGTVDKTGASYGTGDKICLNDKLVISITGGYNSLADIKLRLVAY